jgi:hypothetical protein
MHNGVLFYLFFLIFLFYYSYVHTRLGSFLPSAPTPSTMEFYAATKRNEIMSFAGKWMELEIIIS